MSETIPSAAISDGKARHMIARILGGTIDAMIYGLALLMPVWFLPFTLDAVELNKQTLLIVFTMVAMIAWISKSLLEKRFSLARSWLHLSVAIFLAGYLVVSSFSLDRYISFVGNMGQMQWAFATVAALILLYAVIVNRFRSAAGVYNILFWFLLGSAIAGLYGIVQILGWFPFGAGGMTGVKTFNTIGTINALGTFMVIPMIIASSFVLYGCADSGCMLGKRGAWMLCRAVPYAVIAVGLALAAMINFWPIWASLIFGMVAMSAIPFIRGMALCRPKTIAFPVVLIILSIAFLIYQKPLAPGIPSEVAPSASHTLQIAEGALHDMPLFGSGPGTWLFDYSKYRSIGVNASQFWTIRFERGLSTVLSMPAMIGIIGTALWFLLIVSGIAKSVICLMKKRDGAEWHAVVTIVAAWITTVFIAFIYNYNVAHHFAFWVLLALLGIFASERAFVWDERTKPWIMGLLSAGLIACGAGALSVAWLAGQRLAADATYYASIQAFERGDSIDASLSRLESAISMNRLNDVYARNLSQGYLIRASRALEQQPDEEGMKAVNADIAKAVDAAKAATVMSPANVDNWSNLAVVYQQVASFTKGADEMAIAGYEEALMREPNNPTFMNEIGKLFILRADAYSTLLSNADEAVAKDAEQNVKAELAKALDWLNKAAATKTDYPDAFYNIGLVLERQGKLAEAVSTFEQLLAVNPQDANIALQLAVLYDRNGQKDQARSLFEQIVISNPDHANARWFLAAIYEGEKKYDLAIEQLRAIEKTNPDNAQLKAKIEQLEQAKAAPAAAQPSEVLVPVR